MGKSYICRPFYMSLNPNNLHPVNHLLPRTCKEKQLGQRAKVLWFTGLSGSGKSTIAQGLEQELYDKGFFTVVLDGDNIRMGINNNLGFSEDDRTENIRRIAEVAKLFAQNGIVVIGCFVSPTIAIRDLAKNIIGKDDFLEIFVNTPVEECEKRDVKGLYAKARKGEIKEFTGVSAPFEIPLHPDLEIKTIGKSMVESVQEVLSFVVPHIQSHPTKI